MRTLYIECNMGAAGDMLVAALLELIPDPAAFIDQVNGLGLHGVKVSCEKAVKCGITGTHVRVSVYGHEEGHEHHHHHNHNHDHEHTHEHHDHEHERHEHDHAHNSLHEIDHILSHLDIPDALRGDILGVYNIIAEAESHAHNTPVSQIHFHEVGNMDAICDILMACMLIKQIAPDRVVVSPIRVGSGTVKCAHGILPVPAPATAHILRDVPIYAGDVKGEMCTPTGAALLMHYADAFGDMPPMRVQAVGYGMGTKDFPVANCVRAFLGDTQDVAAYDDEIVQLQCNLDDMTGEDIGYATERLLECGALDVFTAPIYMKQNRPAVMLTVLCKPTDEQRFMHEIFTHTWTLGVRISRMNRYTLQREQRTVSTPYGDVRVKHVHGHGVTRHKPEHADVGRIAHEQNMSTHQAKHIIEHAITGDSYAER